MFLLQIYIAFHKCRLLSRIVISTDSNVCRDDNVAILAIAGKRESVCEFMLTISLFFNIRLGKVKMCIKDVDIMI